MSEDSTVASKTRLLIIDDDTEFCELATEFLAAEGFEVLTVQDAQQGIERASSETYNLILLDVMLPGINGFEVLRRIRIESDVPVLMLTARGEEVDRIVGLELGADDYLPKPFNSRELVARIHAILRRTKRSQSYRRLASVAERLVVGDIELDVGARTVRRAGEPLELTGVEFNLLRVFLEKAGRVVTREQLFKDVLGRRLLPYDRSLDMHVSNLRKKLGRETSGMERIKTLRGHGYIYTLTGQPIPDEEDLDSL